MHVNMRGFGGVKIFPTSTARTCVGLVDHVKQGVRATDPRTLLKKRQSDSQTDVSNHMY